MVKYMDKDLIKMALANKNHFTTASHWDHFAHKVGLPGSTCYVYHFKSWNNAKETIEQAEREFPLEFPFSANKLKAIACTHKKYFKSKAIWNDFAKQKSLPSAHVFIYVFQTWSNAKKIINWESKNYSENWN